MMLLIIIDHKKRKQNTLFKIITCHKPASSTMNYLSWENYMLLKNRKPYLYNHSSSMEYIELGIIQKLLDLSKISSNLGIYWSSYNPRNFGDWVTPYLYFRLCKTSPIRQNPSRYMKTVFAAGSIVRHINVEGSVIVWGSGVISQNDEFAKPYKVCAVRGPFTREKFISKKISCPEIYGDPAILLPRVFRPKVSEFNEKIGIIPHFMERPLFEHVSIHDDFSLIDVTLPIEDVITQIANCSYAVSSSLHGIIVCHAYGVPCAWVGFGENLARKVEGDDVKFKDYFSSVELEEFAKNNLLTQVRG